MPGTLSLVGDFGEHIAKRAATHSHLWQHDFGAAQLPRLERVHGCYPFRPVTNDTSHAAKVS
jgi:hypothetical protein